MAVQELPWQLMQLVEHAGDEFVHFLDREDQPLVVLQVEKEEDDFDDGFVAVIADELDQVADGVVQDFLADRKPVLVLLDLVEGADLHVDEGFG